MSEPFTIKRDWDGTVIVEVQDLHKLIVTAGPNPEILLPGAGKTVTLQEILQVAESVREN
jgi:hypothetical protein